MDHFSNTSPAQTKATALNPMVLIEVTSDSSEDYDNGEKVEYYKTIPSLRDYIVISHRERRITEHSREAQGMWAIRTAIAGGKVRVESLATELSVDEIYRASTIA